MYDNIWFLGIILCVRLDQQKSQIGSALPLLKQVFSNHHILLCVSIGFFPGAFQLAAFYQVQTEATSHRWEILIELLICQLCLLKGLIVLKFQKWPR